MKKLIVIAISVLLLQSCRKEDSDASLISPVVSHEDFVDSRDNNIYKTIKVGQQIWMAENLRYRLAQGSLEGCYTYGEPNIVLTQLSINRTAWRDSILASIDRGEIVDPPGIAPNLAPVNILRTRVNLLTPSLLRQQMAIYPAVYSVLTRINNNLLIPASEDQALINLAKADILYGEYSKNYGLMYTFESAKRAVPDGWRIPTDEDWKILEGNMGMNTTDIERLNAWRGNISDRFLGVNNQDVGFNAQLAGARVYGSFAYGTPFMNKDVAGYYWTSSMVHENDSTDLPIVRNFMKNQSGVWRGTSKEMAAYHIKLIKNN